VSIKEPERTALYRMFDAAGDLLYIGISKNFGIRWRREAASFPWWPEMQRQTVDWYPSRPEAHAAEIAAIKAEKPKYNIQHAAPLPQPRRSIVRRGVGLIADEPDEGCYMVECPDIIAPGTYRITFAYDHDAPAFKAVTVTECTLLEGGDAVSEALGGKVRPIVEAPGMLTGPMSLDEAFARHEIAS